MNQPTQEKLKRHIHFLAQDESNTLLLAEISNMYQELNDFESAQTYLNKAKAIAPEACLAPQGLLYLNQGQLTQALDCFLQALAYEDTPDLRFNLGFCYFMTYELKQAWDVLIPLGNEESIPEVKLLMARILHRQGELDKAVDLVKKNLAHHPSHSESLGLLALLYFDLNEEELAHQMALAALQTDPNNYDAQCVDILIRLLTQQTTAEEIEQLIEINPEDCRMWFALGNTHMTQGDLLLAEQALQKAVDIYPEFYDCLTVLAWCQLLNNKLDQAQNNYKKGTELANELSDGWAGLALVHVLKEEFLDAERLIGKANDLNSDCFLAGVAEAIYFNYKNPLKANTHLLEALKNSKVPIGEKLALVLDDLQAQETVH